MFRTLARALLPNPLDWMVSRCARRKGRKILLCWNRGLGDIALGLYAVVHRIRTKIPDAEVTVLTRENLREGFSLLDGVKVLVAPDWKRGGNVDVKRALHEQNIDPSSFDLIIERPSPTDWVRWQIGQLVPRMRWMTSHDELWKRFELPDGFTYIGVQAVAETSHGPWRDWPHRYWEELFDRLAKWENVRILLFGYGKSPEFCQKNVIDLRGKTTLLELLSIIKNRCHSLVAPDSGIASILYYLDVSFPLRLITLWADPRQGIMKQAVLSPNSQLIHLPLIGRERDLSTVLPAQVIDALFPLRPFVDCPSYESVSLGSIERVGAILLAGGQGSRLGVSGPKGVFPILGKSLFQWICEKAPDKNFPIAVMTSPLNHEETVAFFRENQFFGREIHFFSQGALPLLNEEKKSLGIYGPDGNGSVFKAFAESGLGALFAQRGIDLVTIVPVDNPLAEPADLSLISYARTSCADVVLKCIPRESPTESMGVLVERHGLIEIVEYTEISPSAQYHYSNTGLMAMRLSFILQMAEVVLPYHWVQKRAPSHGEVVWKREKFIFDVLPHAKKVLALRYPRGRCYAPVKDSQSIPSVSRLLETFPS